MGRDPTSDILAHDLFIKGHEMNLKWNYSFDSLYLKLALNLFDQALKIDPVYIDALGGKGQIYREAGKYDSALYYFKKTNEIDPVNLPGAGGIGTVYLYSDNYDSASKYIQITIEHNPNEPWSYVPMGQLLIFNKNDVIKGMPYYQKAYELGGNTDAEINRHLAWIFSFIGDYQRALKYSNSAIKIRSDCGLLIENDIYLAAHGNFSEALYFLDSINRVTTCQHRSDVMKARIYIDMKKFDKAERFFNQAINSGYLPTADDNIYIACLYMETGKEKEGFSILNNSIQRDIDLLKSQHFIFSKLTNLRLAAAYATLGKNKEALTILTDLQKSGIWDPYFNLNFFPGFDSLRSDPEFNALVKRIEDKKASLRAQVKEMELRGEIDL